jgi:alcohol dehydrogenase class IV
VSDSWCFQLSTRVIHGLHSSENLGKISNGCGIHRAMVVTDAGVVGAGVIDRVMTALRDGGVEVVVFDEVEANPLLQTVDRAAKRFASAGCDGVVAVGGGSPLDAGKVVGVLATNPGSVSEYLGSNTIENAPVPVICIPTTAGTGAEVTRAAGLRDRERGIKVGLHGPFVAPRVAVLDPLLTLSLPPGPTRDTGLDALTHAIESCIAAEAWDGTRAVALRAIQLIGRHLRTAVYHADDVEARDGMLTASLLAGIAFLNTDLGIVHSIALTLGGRYDTPHGATNAIALPHAMRFLLPAALPIFAEIASALGEHVEGLSIRDGAELAVRAVVDLSRDTGLPKGLAALGVRSEDLPALAGAMAGHPMARLSPRRATAEDFLEICNAAF